MSAVVQARCAPAPHASFVVVPPSRAGALVRMVALAATMALAACSTTKPPAPEPAPVVQSLDEWMVQADQALKDGQHEKAREACRGAAQAYPTAKQPWLRLAEDYFNAADYGNAILAGQEALQRDPQDSLAHSILAVSGLRVTAGSLRALRKDAAYPVGSRDEALAVTRSLRDALGETALLPAAAAAPAPTKPVAAARHRAAPAHTAAPTHGPAPAPASGGNPFDKLK
jgi:predicted Zn-dependent protease